MGINLGKTVSILKTFDSNIDELKYAKRKLKNFYSDINRNWTAYEVNILLEAINYTLQRIDNTIARIEIVREDALALARRLDT